MAEEKLLTVREVAIILGVSEKEVINLSESGKLPTYKIAGIYFRFKREEVEEFKKDFHPASHKAGIAGKEGFLKDKLGDFFYFNDFYIFAILLIIVLLIIIFQKY